MSNFSNPLIKRGRCLSPYFGIFRPITPFFPRKIYHQQETVRQFLRGPRPLRHVVRRLLRRLHGLSSVGAARCSAPPDHALPEQCVQLEISAACGSGRKKHFGVGFFFFVGSVSPHLSVDAHFFSPNCWVVQQPSSFHPRAASPANLKGITGANGRFN